MSYREIQYLVEYKKYCEDSSKRGKSTKHINGRTYSNKYESFCNEYSKQIKVSSGEVDYVFLHICLLYTSDAADEEDSVDLGGRRIIKKKKNITKEKQRKPLI